MKHTCINNLGLSLFSKVILFSIFPFSLKLTMKLKTQLSQLTVLKQTKHLDII